MAANKSSCLTFMHWLIAGIQIVSAENDYFIKLASVKITGKNEISWLPYRMKIFVGYKNSLFREQSIPRIINFR